MIHKQRLNNRILSLVLALAMVLSMLPVASLTAFAADASTPTTGLSSVFYANGTDLFVDAGTSGGTAIYYYNGDEKVYLNGKGAAGDTFNGNSVFIYAGGYDKLITADVTITVLGGSVGNIYSAGSYGGANIIGNVTVKQMGGTIETVYGRGGVDAATVTGNTTMISLDGTVTNVWGMDGALCKSDTGWTLSGDAVLPSDMTIEIAEGETFTVPADSSIKNNGTIVNNGRIELYGYIFGNDVTGNGTFEFYAAYIKNVSSVSSISAKINGTAVTLENGQYRLSDGNLYIWLPSGNAEVILNGDKYYGKAVMGEKVELTTGYKQINDISNIPSEITAYVKTTLAPVTNETTFNPAFSYEIVSEGTTAPGAELNGSAIYASGSGTVKLKVTASDGYSSYSETFDIEVKDAGYAASIENGDIIFEKYNDTQIKVTHAGFSGGFLIIEKDEYFSITGTSGNTCDVTVMSGEVNIILNNCSISLNEYEKQPFSISAGASVNLVLTGNNDIVNDYYIDVSGNYAGIHLPSGASLTIDGTGSLDVKGGYTSAGIGGGNNESAGELIINGGRIDATGGKYGAGIGGGYKGNGGTIIINGGRIDATGGKYGAGIGGGDSGAGGTITINGGTVTATGSSGAGIGGGYGGNGGTVTISGGTVKASSETGEQIGKGITAIDSGTLKDANGNTVSLKTITLNGAAADTAVAAVTGMTYGVNDVYTLDTNKLYFYLAETPGESSVTAGGKDYICNRNLTYYESHSSAYNITETTHDVVCSGCNAVITAGVSHVYDTDDKCVCGKINHTHEWKYVAEGTTITATCMNTDSGCLDTAGGSVTIAEPDNLTYNGSSKDATLSYTGWKPEEIPAITYSGEADRVKVTGNDITASITLGDAEAKVTYQVEAAAITGAIVTVDVTAPEADVAKQTMVNGGADYSAAISWNCDTDNFGYNTAYTATVTLTADSNHKFTSGLTASGWNVVVSADGNTATLTKTFEATRKEKLTAISAPTDSTLSKYYTNVADAITELPTTITYTTESGEITVDIQWVCSNYDNVVTKANTFTWRVKDGELDNYNVNGIATDGEITVTNACAIIVENSGTDKSITYTGSTYDVAGMFTIDENAGEASYTITGGTGEGVLNDSVLTITEVGTFEIKLTTAADGAYAAGEATATLTVKKGAGSGTVTIEGWTYGEDANAPVINSSTNGTAGVTYLYESTDGKGYTGSAAPENAGSYKLTVTFAETNLYETCTDDATFTIEQKKLTPVICGSVAKVYDNSNTVPANNSLAIVTDDIVGNDDVRVTASYTYDGVNVGTTKINATDIAISGTDAGNYKLTSASVSANVGEITAKNIADVTVILGEALTYIGSEQEQTFTVNKLDGLTVTYDVSGNKEIKVGIYELTITANGNFAGTKTVQYTVVPDTSAIAGLTTGNATSANEEAIKAVVAQIEAADKTLSVWDTVLADCQDILTRISEVRTENNRIANAADGYTLDSVKSTDKEALAQIAADAQTLLNGGNVTVDEKKALEEIKAKAEGLLKTIEEANNPAGTTSPGTGDKSDISGLFAFMIGSMAAVFGILFGTKKKKE